MICVCMCVSAGVCSSARGLLWRSLYPSLVKAVCVLGSPMCALVCNVFMSGLLFASADLLEILVCLGVNFVGHV